MITGIDAYVTFLKYARLWEMERTEGGAAAAPVRPPGEGRGAPEKAADR